MPENETKQSNKGLIAAVIILFLALGVCGIWIIWQGFPAVEQIESMKTKVDSAETHSAKALTIAKNTEKKMSDTLGEFHQMVKDLKSASDQLAEIKASDKTAEEKIKEIDELQKKFAKLNKNVRSSGDTNKINAAKKLEAEFNEIKATVTSHDEKIKAVDNKVTDVDNKVVAQSNEVILLKKQLEEQRKYYDSLATTKKSFFGSKTKKKEEKKKEEVKENKMELPTDGKMGKKSSTTGQDYPDGFK